MLDERPACQSEVVALLHRLQRVLEPDEVLAIGKAPQEWRYAMNTMAMRALWDEVGAPGTSASSVTALTGLAECRGEHLGGD
jgi:hypothetical protein